MSGKRRIGGLSGVALLGLVVAVLVLLIPATAASKRAAISGTLSRSGYTVIALAANGRATSVVAKRGGFRLVPAAAVVTLQLRTAKGKYAGPVLVGGGGQRVITGVKAGARLGKVNVSVAQGCARVVKRLPAKWLDASRWARARNGVPIGNGRDLGLVRSKPPRKHPPGDLDADGVPDVLDVDVNGNLVLNNLDRSTVMAHIAQGTAQTAQVGNAFRIASELPESLDQTANAHANGTIGQVDASLRSNGQLNIGILPGGPVQLDCGRPQSRTDPALGGLVYCTRGGTGRIFRPGVSYAESTPFPDCCDADNNGFGTVTPEPGSISPQGPGGAFRLWHGATTAQIGSGDLLVERLGGSEFLATLQFLFATVPALDSYSDTATPTDSAAVDYPVRPSDHGIGGGRGTLGNPFPVAAGSDGHIKLTLTFWRPQRKPIPAGANGVGGDACLNDTPACQWVDIQGLTYMVQAASPPRVTLPISCPQDAYLPNQRLATPTWTPFFQAPGGLTDRATDAANPLKFTIDMTTCLAAHNLSWNPGERWGLNLVAATGVSDAANQGFTFIRQH